MKNAVLNLAFGLLLLSVLPACKKDPTFGEQLTGHWKSTQVTIGNEDVSDTYAYDLNLASNQEFNLDIYITFFSIPAPDTIVQSFNGDWDDQEKKQDLMLRFSNGEEETWDILSLSASSLTMESISADNKRYQIKFVRQ